MVLRMGVAMGVDEQKSSDLGLLHSGVDGWQLWSGSFECQNPITLVAGPLSHPSFQRLDTATPTLKLVRVLTRFIN